MRSAPRALRYIDEVMGKTMIDYDVVGLNETKLMDVLLACIITVFFFYFLYHAVSDMQVKKIDESILQFANLLHSYSYQNDLISVFESITPQLEEPLKTAVATCVAESRVDGDVSGAIGRLSLKMRHRKLTELLQALEAGSKNNANYKAIIGRCYDSITIYKGEKEIRRATARGARINIILMLLIFVLCIATLVFFLELHGRLWQFKKLLPYQYILIIKQL